MRALISGGTGFVGGHLAAALLADEHEVFLFGRETSEIAAPDPRLRFFEGDIRDAGTVHRLVSDVRPDQIYHLAAISSVPLAARNPWLTFEINVGGTLNLLEAAVQAAPAARILNVSTGQVYGAPSRSGVLWSEDAPVRPTTPYATSKAMAELLIGQYGATSGIHVVTARSFNHIGAGQLPEFVLASFAQQFASIEAGLAPPVLRVGNVDVERDFTDVRDVVRAYRLLLDHGKRGGVYNVCSGRTRPLSEAIDILRRLTSKSVEIEAEASRSRGNDLRVVGGNPAKLQAETGWSPMIPFETSLRDVLDYWRSRTRSPLSSAR